MLGERPSMVVAEEAFQSPMGWLKAEALKKIWLKLVTAEASHPLMSSLKVVRSLKASDISVTWESAPVADVPVGGGGVRFVAEPQVHRILIGVGRWSKWSAGLPAKSCPDRSPK